MAHNSVQILLASDALFLFFFFDSAVDVTLLTVAHLLNWSQIFVLPVHWLQ